MFKLVKSRKYLVILCIVLVGIAGIISFDFYTYQRSGNSVLFGRQEVPAAETNLDDLSIDAVHIDTKPLKSSIPSECHSVTPEFHPDVSEELKQCLNSVEQQNDKNNQQTKKETTIRFELENNTKKPINTKDYTIQIPEGADITDPVISLPEVIPPGEKREGLIKGLVGEVQDSLLDLKVQKNKDNSLLKLDLGL